MSLSRLGPNLYEGTLRSGTIWQGDAELLRTLPQGEAKLATLQTRERVAQAKAKAKAKAKAEEEPPRDKEEPGESSASRRGGGEHGEADAPDRGGDAQLHGAPQRDNEHLIKCCYPVAQHRLKASMGMWLLQSTAEANV